MAAKRWDTHEVAAERRRVFGRDFVPSREDAEREARRIIDTRIGHMNAEEIVQLGRVFNRHGKTGQIRQDRFSPGFAGAVMAKLAQNTERFNEVVSRLWRGHPDDAVYLLGQMFADRSILPGAGSSLPSYLLYLRDPERFGICLNATMISLGVEVGERFRAHNQEGYERFCAALVEWRREYGVAPQEADAILTEIMRRSRPEAVPEPVDPRRSVRPLMTWRRCATCRWNRSTRGWRLWRKVCGRPCSSVPPVRARPTSPGIWHVTWRPHRATWRSPSFILRTRTRTSPRACGRKAELAAQCAMRSARASSPSCVRGPARHRRRRSSCGLRRAAASAGVPGHGVGDVAVLPGEFYGAA